MLVKAHIPLAYVCGVQALQAVDGLCDTCASARNPDGNYFTVVLPVRFSCGGVLLPHLNKSTGLLVPHCFMAFNLFLR